MLRTAGLRVTQPRIVVLSSVQAHPHSDTDTIYGLAREVLPVVSRQAIYDVLDALTVAGLLRRIQPAGHVARYETRVGDNHHHIVCRSCGFIVDADCAAGEVQGRRQRSFRSRLIESAAERKSGPVCTLSSSINGIPSILDDSVQL